MKSLFSQSGQVFTQFWVFEAILEARGKFFWSFKNSLWTFYCTQNECLNAMVSMQSRFKNWATLGRDICEKQNGVAIWFCMPCLNFFYKYLGTGWSVFQTDLFILYFVPQCYNCLTAYRENNINLVIKIYFPTPY